MKVLVQKNSDLTEEYKLPVGGEVIAVNFILKKYRYKYKLKYKYKYTYR